ncbi:uncharacterized protein K489DRAFT_149455 [Dissoconium aciculare CBS 342.82]|uniref:Uncharacterized protein n=1 Tax=Dissoconium aciculare CBS 342.82 TaxID=1314786 RepID=A0A6J3ME44_9PEZI|nr:uncharacterized protein K489DRAFT_149455 [Dissoconium aciculare CBS 342.82]KAF1825122.1 hypothetical protein K489DRAFT_149455 [Dissoconium aciculare CBS 342.82]
MNATRTIDYFSVCSLSVGLSLALSLARASTPPAVTTTIARAWDVPIVTLGKSLDITGLQCDMSGMSGGGVSRMQRAIYSLTAAEDRLGWLAGWRRRRGQRNRADAIDRRGGLVWRRSIASEID